MYNYWSGPLSDIGEVLWDLWIVSIEIVPRGRQRPVITMTSQWDRWRLKSPASPLFTQPFIRRRSKKTPKLSVTGLCTGNSSVTGEFPAQMASNTENVSISWRHRTKLPIPWLITHTHTHTHGDIHIWINRYHWLVINFFSLKRI